MKWDRVAAWVAAAMGVGVAAACAAGADASSLNLVALPRAFAAFQPVPPSGPCICPKPLDAPPRTTIRETRTIPVRHEIGDPKYHTKPGDWLFLDACDCNWYPHGEYSACPPEPCNEGSMTSTVTEKVCWNVSGSVGVSFQIACLNELLALIGEASIEVAYESCREVSTSRTWRFPASMCWTTVVRELQTIVTIKGDIYAYQECDWWERRLGEFGVWEWVIPVGTTQSCIYKDGVTSVSATDSYGLQSVPKACGVGCGPDGGPGVCPIPDDDEYEGRRRQPCCRPIYLCDEINIPYIYPCCGCEAVR